MPKLTTKNVTKKKLLLSMLRGWDGVKWTSGAYLRDSHGAMLDRNDPPTPEGKALNPYTWRHVKPCSACAVGAVMLDQRLSAQGVFALIDAVGVDLGDVTTRSDEAGSKAKAIKAMKTLLGEGAIDA